MEHRRKILAIALLTGSSAACADPGVFIGAVYNFGSTSNLGISLKVLSTNEEDHAAAGAGVSYYPFVTSNQWGADLSAGYVFQNSALTAGWDFLANSPQLGIGYVNTKDDKSSPPPQASDRRLKKNVTQLMTLDNGIRIYSFQYFWSDEVYVGVMAQDLLEMPDYRNAVTLTPGNFYVVDYRSLGLRMISLQEWRESEANIRLSQQQPREAALA